MTAVLAAIITLIGTLIVGGLGFWQWQRSQQKDTQKDYHAKRVETLTGVWDALTEIEETQRGGLEMEAEPLHTEHVKRVNLLLMRFSPFLLDDERVWAVSIVQYIVEIDAMMRSMRQKGPQEIGWWAITAGQPREAGAAATAASKLNSTKAALGDRYAAVLRGDHH